jgi:hypothetical protein
MRAAVKRRLVTLAAAASLVLFSAAAVMLLVAGTRYLSGSPASSRPTRPTPGVSRLEPLLAFEVNRRWGYRDTAGNVVIPPTFDDVQDRFEEEFAYARLDGQRGLIDRHGAWHVGPREWMIGPYREGRAAICIAENGYKWGFIDSSGAVVIPAQYDAVREFSGGVAQVGNQTTLSKVRTTFADVGIDVDWHYIDRDGNRVE